MKNFSNRLEEGIFNCLVETGRAAEDYRIKIVEREIIGNSDYAKVAVNLYKPRKKKHCITWYLCINIARNQIHWDKSEFVRLDN